MGEPTQYFSWSTGTAKYKDEPWRRAVRTAATQARRNIGVACHICFGMSRNECRSSQKSYKGITESSKTKRAYFAILYLASFYSSIIHQMIDFRSIKPSRPYQSEIISNVIKHISINCREYETKRRSRRKREIACRARGGTTKGKNTRGKKLLEVKLQKWR